MRRRTFDSIAIAVSMIAMVLVERKHSAAGGVLLAFVTMAKLYPGLLVIYLLVRREWRALVWTAAPERRSLALFLVGFIVLNLYVPNDSGIDPRLLALVSTISQALTVALAVGVIRRFVMPWNANLFASPEVFDQHQIATATHQPSE